MHDECSAINPTPTHLLDATELDIAPLLTAPVDKPPSSGLILDVFIDVLMVTYVTTPLKKMGHVRCRVKPAYF
jgi:hypothetical protein